MKTETIGMITLIHQMFIPKLLLIAEMVSVYESEFKRGDDYTLFRPIHLRHVVLWNVFFKELELVGFTPFDLGVSQTLLLVNDEQAGFETYLASLWIKILFTV